MATPSLAPVAMGDNSQRKRPPADAPRGLLAFGFNQKRARSDSSHVAQIDRDRAASNAQQFTAYIPPSVSTSRLRLRAAALQMVED